MKSMRFVSLWLLTAAFVFGVRPATAQSSITQTDIQRLETAIYDASRDVAQLRSRDATLANRLDTELDDARDEATYLKVKLRKNETVSRNDYRDVSDRVDRIRAEARGDTNQSSAPSTKDNRGTREGGISDTPTTVSRAEPGVVPSGTEFDVRLTKPLNSGTAQVEDRVEATTVVDLTQSDRVLVPAGSTMRGVVTSVNKAGHIDRKGSLTVSFDRITARGQNYPIQGTVTQALESEGIKGDAGKIGAGAGVGGIIGGIIGGVKGALAGILIGGGGTIAATEGKDVDLPSGTVLRVRLDSNLDMR